MIEDHLLAAVYELGGTAEMLPGARVAARAIRIASNAREDMKSELKNRGLKFIDLVKKLALEGRLKYFPRSGSDFLVGLPTAEISDTPTYSKIRQDFYKAFLRVRTTLAFYNLEKDQIIFTVSTATGILIPSPSESDMWSMRSQFVCGLADTPQKELLGQELLKENRSYATFSELVKFNSLHNEWIGFQYAYSRQLISSWAGENEVPVREDWFNTKTPKRSVLRSSRESIFEHLNPDELSRILVPADIVQALLARAREL